MFTTQCPAPPLQGGPARMDPAPPLHRLVDPSPPPHLVDPTVVSFATWGRQQHPLPAANLADALRPLDTPLVAAPVNHRPTSRLGQPPPRLMPSTWLVDALHP
jgi:hypothetical protein